MVKIIVIGWLVSTFLLGSAAVSVPVTEIGFIALAVVATTIVLRRHDPRY